MLNVLRNNYLRMMKRLPMMLALLLVTLTSLLLGVYISGQQVKDLLLFSKAYEYREDSRPG